LGVVTSTVLTTSYMLIGTFFTIGGAVLTKWFVTLLGKSRTYAAFMLIAALSCAAVFFLKPSQIIPLFILQFITSFAMGPVSVLQWAIYTDTAEYQEWKNNRRSTAFIMAASLFALKMGVAFGGAALGWILSGYGYDETLDIQSETAKHGMHMAMSIYSALAALGAMVFMLFYPLNKTKLESMEADLQSRRQDDEDNAAAAAAGATA
jgi:GPH family glycoside/pentoside/hexuronide:cation symporter